MQRQKQIRKQVQLTAHQKVLVLENFHFAIEALEEYIEKTGYYPDFRKQIFKKSINDASRTPAELADDFLAQLLCFKAIVNNKPEFFREEIKIESYKWINATGINTRNCPQELKHYLFEINEILEGRGDKIVEQTRELIEGKEVDPRDLVKLVGFLQKPLNDNREKGESRKGKTYRDVEVDSRFDGDARQGDIAFNQMAWEFNHEHFNFFPEFPNKKRQRANDDLGEWLREEEEKEARKQLNKRARIDEIRETEQLVKEQEERKRLEDEQRAQAEAAREKARQERAQREQAEKARKQAEQRAKEQRQIKEQKDRERQEKEELAAEKAKVFSQVQAHWSERQDEQQRINGQSIHQILGESWKNKILNADNKVKVEACQNLFIGQINDAKNDKSDNTKKNSLLSNEQGSKDNDFPLSAKIIFIGIIVVFSSVELLAARATFKQPKKIKK